MRNRILLVGGELCQRVAMNLDPDRWQMLGLRRNPPPGTHIRWLQADLGNPASLGELPSDISHVLYAPSPDTRDRASYQTTYPLGVEHLLDALTGTPCLQRFVLVGSTVVWPAADAAHAMAWMDETTPTRADNFRSQAILQAEAIVSAKLPDRSVALRLGGIYGPGRTRLVDRLRNDLVVAPDGPGHWTNRIHIEDAASACIHLLGLSKPASCYIGTDGNPTSASEFYDALADILRVPHPAHRVLPPSGKRLSNARLVGSGWTPRWLDALAGYQAMVDGQSSPQHPNPGVSEANAPE